MGSLRGISERDGACAINFFSNQPALNYGFYQPDPEKPWQQSFDDEGPQATLAAMEDVMRFWLNMGCDGFRVDMAGSLVKNDQEAQRNHPPVAAGTEIPRRRVPGCSHGIRVGRAGQILTGRLPHGLPASLWTVPLQRSVPLR